GKRIDVAIARFAEADEEERLVGALERGGRRQSRKLSHEPHEVDARHPGNKRVALGHVTDQAFDLIRLAANVAAEDSRGAGRRSMKTEQGVNQGGLAGAVRPQQADRAAAQFAVKAFQDWPAAKGNR